MGRQLYDLAGAEPERRFSPYCWRAKLALIHKGLPFDTIPWRFNEKKAIAFSGQGRVPVLVDGGHPSNTAFCRRRLAMSNQDVMYYVEYPHAAFSWHRRKPG
jgi:glutaredoxin